MKTKLSSYNSFMVEFVIEVDEDLFGEVDGELIVSGDKFFIESSGYEIFFDGKQRYTYNDDDNEVVIENIDPADNNILTNPSRFFRFTESDFSHAYKGTSGSTAVVELRPKNADAGYSAITISVDAQTNLPVKIVYELDGAGSNDIIIEKITPNVTVSAATFTFDRKKYPGVEVTDWSNIPR